MHDVLTGVTKKTVEAISEVKREPRWMLEKRLTALEVFRDKKMPLWGPSDQLNKLDFNKLQLYIRPDTVGATSWDDIPKEIREKYDALGIPEGEQQFLSGLGAQYESEMIYHAVKADLEAQGVIFEDMTTAVHQHPDLVQRYLGTVISPGNNKFSALNSAVWSGGSFVYIPKGVYLEAPLHNFFQMQSPSQGQFERTLIIADVGSAIEFLEGCVAPLYSSLSLHAGVVEIIVKKGATVRYSTMQNWSKNVLNLVTKGSYVEEEGTVEWVDGNVGSGVTMKYPSMVLAGRKAHGRLTSLAIAGKDQVIDSGGKAIHLASETTSQIESRSVVKDGGRSTFRGDVVVHKAAHTCRADVRCVSLHLDSTGRSDSYPRFRVHCPDAVVEHESSVTAVTAEQMQYAQSRGLSPGAARGLIVGGFAEPFASDLPMEYAVEYNRLLELEVGDDIG